MKVFITGGTGFVGEEVLGQLYHAGHSLLTLARDPDSPRVGRDVGQFGMKVHPGDVTKPETLRGLEGIDAVIHLSGIIREAGGNTFENVHVRGTQNVVAAARAAGVKRFLHMSALGTRSNAASRYHQSKWAAEEIVRGSGLDFTIFRPSVIYGRGDAFVSLFAKISRFSPIIPILGNGRSKLQPVPIGDVGTCFLKALSEPAAVGQTYDLCGRDALTLGEILDAILAVTGRTRLKVHLPMFLARLQAAGFEAVFPGLGKTPPFTRDQLIMLGEDNVGNSEPAKALFKLNPVSFREGITRFLRE